jgi:hypothetical protein
VAQARNVAFAATKPTGLAAILGSKAKDEGIAMGGINLKFTEEKEKLPVGASKFLGNPDVWDGFEWPHFTEDGEDYDLKFLCQINCAEAALFDWGGLLPKTGMLYFFYDMDEMPQESSDNSAARILYYNGELSALRQMLLTDHDGGDMSFREMKIHFNAQGKIGEDYQASLGETLPMGWQPVLQILPFETDRVSIKFDDDKALCFFIDKPKLERRDFSDIHMRQMRNNYPPNVFDLKGG